MEEVLPPRWRQREGDSDDASCSRLPLLALDDGCLVNIFRFLTPLPDLFNAAAVCRVRPVYACSATGKGQMARALTGLRSPPLRNVVHQRFRHVATDRRLALTVGREEGGGSMAQVHTSLQAAFDASLPGHTIFVEAGRHLAQNVAIRCVCPG